MPRRPHRLALTGRARWPLESLGADAKTGAAVGVGIDGAPLPEGEEPTLPDRLKTLLIGKPRDWQDQSIFTHVSLVAFLAWVGLGADGLSSSCYGPAEAFHQPATAIATWPSFWPWPLPPRCSSSRPATATSSRRFPAAAADTWWPRSCSGRRVGVVSGCALLVDYVLTITVSIAAAGDALFGLLGPSGIESQWKLYAEFAAIVVSDRPEPARREGIGADLDADLPAVPADALHADRRLVVAATCRPPATVAQGIATEVAPDLHNPEVRACCGMLALLLHAYSLGAGTYTGIEAVSNSMPVMREPRVATAKRTMRYMAFSLAFTAGGLIVAYLLLDIRQPSGDKTLNQVLAETFIERTRLRRPLAGRGLRAGRRCFRKGRCCSSPPRPASSTARACWPTWPTTPGCPAGSPTSPNGWPRTTASC